MEGFVGTYHGKGDNAIGEKVVVETWQICAAPGEELNCGVDFYDERIGGFDDIENLFFLLLELMDLPTEVFVNGGGALKRRQSGNVV